MSSRAAKRRKSGPKPPHKPSKYRASATAAACPSCKTQVLPAARFCHACGVSLEAPPAAAGLDVKMVALVVAVAVAIVSVVFATAIIVTQNKTQTPPPRPAAGSGVGTAPSLDLSSMTPRQAADRLFNRVVMANEQGNLSEALQFAPMAVQAYDSLGTLDADAHYHLGLIHVVTGDIDKVREQVTTLRKLVPDHLLGFTLEHAIAEQIGDEEVAARAAAAFAAAYDSEITMGRQEYADHRRTIEQFRAAVEASANKRE